MSLPYTWTSGALPTILGSGVTAVSGGLGTGGQMMRFAQVSGDPCAIRHDLDLPAANVATRVYIKTPTSWASAATSLITYWSSTYGVVAQVALAGTGTPGQVRLRTTGGSTVASSPNNTVSVDTWYRLELQIDAGNTRARAAVFAMGSTTPLWTSDWSTHVDYGTSVQYLLIGNTNASPTLGEYHVDELRHQTPPAAAWIGPSSLDVIEDPGGGDPGGGGGGSFPVVWDGGALPSVLGSGVSVDDGSLLFEQNSGEASAVSWSFSPTLTEVAARAYVYTPATWASASYHLIRLTNSNDFVASLAISGAGQPGQIRLVAPGGENVAVAPVGSIQTSTWYRVELQFQTGSQRARVVVFPMGSSTHIWESGWQVRTAFSTPITHVQVGNSNTSPTVSPFRVSDILLDSVPSAAWLGPADHDEVVDGGDPPDFWPIVWSQGDIPPSAGDVTVVAGGISGDDEALLFTDDSSPTYVGWDFGSVVQTDIAARVYFKTPEMWSEVAFNLISLWTSPSEVSASLALSGQGQPGQIRLRRTGGNTVASAPNNTIMVDTWYRMELQYRSGSQSARVAVFPVGSDNPVWASDWETHANFEASIRMVRVGNPSANPEVPPFLVDEIRVENTPIVTWIGRSTDDEVTTNEGKGSVYLGRGNPIFLGQTPVKQGQNSGLAHSHTHDVLWTHTDTGGGNGNEIYAISDTNASLQATITLPGLAALDMESICVSHYDGKIYVADIGNSTGGRTTNGTLVIAVINQPSSIADATVTPALHSITYSDAQNRDAESLAIHPKTGVLYIVSKDDGTLWSAPSLNATGVTVFSPVSGGPYIGERVSGMDISPDGHFAIVTEGNDDEFLLYQLPGWTLVDRWEHQLPGNLEAVCWSADGSAIYYANDTQNNSVGSVVYRQEIYRETAPGGDPGGGDPGGGDPGGEEPEVPSAVTRKSAITQGIPVPRAPSWDPEKEYRVGQVVTHAGDVYLGVSPADVGVEPGTAGDVWQPCGLGALPNMVWSMYAKLSEGAGTGFLLPAISFYSPTGRHISTINALGTSTVPVFDTFGEVGESLQGRVPPRQIGMPTWTEDLGSTVTQGGSVLPSTFNANGNAAATIPVASSGSTLSISVTWLEPMAGKVPAVALRYQNETNWVRVTRNSIQERSGGSVTTLTTLSRPFAPGDRLAATINHLGVVKVNLVGEDGSLLLVGEATVTAADTASKRGLMWSDG